MTYLYAVLVILILCLIFIFGYYLNSKVKIDCDNQDMCEGCKIESCYHRVKKEEK